MKLCLSLFILLSFSSFASAACWMVKLEKDMGVNGSMRGSGYLVKFQNRTFVRTAAHVILGDLQNLKITDCKNRPLKIKNYISNSMLDDALIEVDPLNLLPLGIYHPGLDLFLVTKAAYAEFLADKRRVSIEPQRLTSSIFIREDSYLSPLWVPRKNFKFESKDRNALLRGLGHNPVEKYSGQSRRSVISDLILADMSVIPGESGSPIVGWSTYSSLDPDDISFSMKVHQYIDRGLVDEQNQVIDALIDPSYRTVAYIKGHVLGYHRSFLLSKFLSSQKFSDLQRAYLKTPGMDVSFTSWIFKDNNEYRVYKVPGLEVSEMQDGVIKSGDGTSGHGGDGTAGHGGDGTAGHGGDTKETNLKIPIGIPYNGVSAISFKLKNPRDLKLGIYKDLGTYFSSEAYLLANWSNFAILNFIQGLNPNKVYDVVSKQVNLLDFFTERFGDHHSTYMSCQVDSRSLKNGILKVQIQLGAISGDEVISYADSIQSFQSLVTLPSKNFGAIDVDFSGLMGIDLSFISAQYFPEYDLVPSILIRQKGSATERYECSLI
jgi:hypothetical protein